MMVIKNLQVLGGLFIQMALNFKLKALCLKTTQLPSEEQFMYNWQMKSILTLKPNLKTLFLDTILLLEKEEQSSTHCILLNFQTVHSKTTLLIMDLI